MGFPARVDDGDAFTDQAACDDGIMPDLEFGFGAPDDAKAKAPQTRPRASI